MLPNIPDAALAMRISWDVPLGALLVVPLLVAAAIGVVVETGVVGALAARGRGRATVGRDPVAAAAPRS
ncbi:MAG TPA: hypothetical protein VIS07_22530 [Candidatus Binatia bacterium]